MNKAKKLLSSNIAVLILAIILLCILMTILSPYFLTFDNIKNIASQTTIYGLLAIGMTFVILTGGIDLSVGSVLAFAGVTLALCIKAEIPFAFSVIICILAGLASGAVNGVLVTLCNVPPFIASMGTLNIFRGAALVITKGTAVTGLGTTLQYIGSGEIAKAIPVPFLIMLICFGIAYFLLGHTRFGRYLYVLGGNSEAARFCGIRVKLYKFMAYAICGITAALASIVMSGRLNSAQPIAADGYELDAIAAVVLGGVSMNGGAGSIMGTFLGAITMTIVRNGMNLLNVHTYWQKVVLGVIIIAAVMMDTMKKNKR